MAQVARQSPLLKLPPELREHIYHFALAEVDIIAVNSVTSTAPALLLTCRKIRRESEPIFYASNEFRVSSVNWAVPCPAAHWIHNKVPAENLKLYFTTTNPVWTNLLDWLQKYHARQVDTRPFGQASKVSDTEILAKAFDIVDIMRAVEWKVVSEVLETFKDAVAINNSTWSWA
jgi:hypothetical protein